MTLRMGRHCGIALAICTAWLGATSAVRGHSLAELEGALLEREAYVEIVDRPAPDFALKDAEGVEIDLSDLRGKVVILWFVYTSCPDFCPLHSEVVAGIQESVNSTPMRDLVQFVAITTDPERDTPSILRAYGLAHDFDAANWVFLTSGADALEATRKLASAYGLEFTTTSNGDQMHGVVTHLIDKSGNLRARYHGLSFDPTNLIVHINALTNDDH